jgi:hypothetical protein
MLDNLNHLAGIFSAHRNRKADESGRQHSQRERFSIQCKQHFSVGTACHQFAKFGLANYIQVSITTGVENGCEEKSCQEGTRKESSGEEGREESTCQEGCEESRKEKVSGGFTGRLRHSRRRRFLMGRMPECCGRMDAQEQRVGRRIVQRRILRSAQKRLTSASRKSARRTGNT